MYHIWKKIPTLNQIIFLHLYNNMINTLNDSFNNKVENKPEQKFDDNSVINAFSCKSTLKHYKNATLNLGLRESEKIIFQKYIDKNDNILDIGCGS